MNEEPDEVSESDEVSDADQIKAKIDQLQAQILEDEKTMQAATQIRWSDDAPPLTQAQILSMNGLKEVLVDLAGEGKAIATILEILQSQPEHSRDRIWDVITRLINPLAFEKSNLQHLAELSTAD